MEEQPRTWQEVYEALTRCGMDHATAYQRADDYINQRLRWEAQAEGHTTLPEVEPTESDVTDL